MYDDDWWRDVPERPSPSTDFARARQWISDYRWPILFCVLGVLAVRA